MRNKKIIKAVSAITALSLIILTAAGCAEKPVSDNPVIQNAVSANAYIQQEYTEAAVNLKKNETVYINCLPDGTTKSVTVTDWLHSDTPQVRAEDVSNLKDIYNVKTLTEPIIDGNRLYWDMDTTDLYYSGRSESEPPVTFKIKYYLDGKELTAQEIAGKKGNVTVEITAENKLKKKISVKGKEYEIFCPMLAVGGTILSEDSFQSIAVSGGSALSDGAKQVVFFAGIPGMDKSLGLSSLKLDFLPAELTSDTYKITAYTECFELGNIMFAVMPISSVGSVGIGDMPSALDSIREILSDIEVLETALNSLDIQRIIDLLYGDSDKIGQIMQAVSDASKLYSENERLLKVLGDMMTEENLKKIDGIIEGLNNTDLEALSKTLSDPALQALLKLLPDLSENLSGAMELAEQLEDAMPIFNRLTDELENKEVKESLENLPQTLKKLDEILTVMEENRELLNTVGDFAGGSGSKQLEQVLNTAQKYAGLDNLSAEQTEALAGKISAWLQFGMDYKIFTQCPEGVQSSVMFTYKTDAVKAGHTDSSAVAEQPHSAEDADGITGWFKKLFGKD